MRQLPILMYHWFRAGGAPSGSRSPQLEITPERFERQLRALRAGGWRTIGLGRACAAPGAAPPPARSLVLSFDDGTLDFWTVARPALERHGCTATLFVVTGHVGGESAWDRRLGEPPRPLMSWEQLAELDRRGFEIGSHTHSHTPFIELDDEAVRDEARRSREILAERLGRPPAFLAYPRGFYHERHKRIVREAGYAGACAVILGWRDLLRSDPFELRRMTIKGDESMLRFRLRLVLAGCVRQRARPERR